MTDKSKRKEEKAMSDKKSFEEQLQNVEEILASLEDGKLPLEESLKKYEQGMKLLKQLETQLEDVSRKLTVIRDGQEVPKTGKE